MNKPRIIVTISDGMAEVYCEHIEPDAIELVMIDYDTDGATEDDGVTYFAAEPVFFTVGAPDPIDDDMSRSLRNAYDHWALA